MKKKCLIYILNQSRDSFGLFLIGEHLKKKNFEVYFANDKNINIKIEYLKPDATLLSWCSTKYTQTLVKKALKYGKVFIYSPEYDHDIYYHNQAPKSLRNKISKVFCMGKNDYFFYLKNKIYNKSQIEIVGNLSHDLLIFEGNKKKKNISKKIGILLQGDMINHKNHKIISMLFRAAIKHISLNYKFSKRWLMDCMQSVFDVYFIFKYIVQLKCKDDMIIRPHPWEDLETYKKTYFDFFNTDQRGKIKFDYKSSTIANWLKDKRVLVHSKSTASVDATLMKLPVISILDIDEYKKSLDYVHNNFWSYISKEEKFMSYLKYQWKPKNLGELNKLLSMKKIPIIPIKNSKKYLNSLNNLFFIFKKKQTYVYISDEISSELNNQSGNFFKKNSSLLDFFKYYLKLITSFNLAFFQIKRHAKRIFPQINKFYKKFKI